jgi:2-dehydro-3-deoxygalactonokinase
MSGPALIGIDWGTTSFRAYLLDAGGAILDRREAAAGILQIADRDFAGALESQIGAWIGQAPQLPVVASGMITSRQGWVELPYVACPGGAAALAAGLVGHEARPGLTIRFVPGLSTIGSDGVPDVMRGEETQLLGVLDTDPKARLLVMPGTHSKWVLVADGRIEHFATFMTGEVFAVLKAHSILGRLMEDGEPDPAAFERGVRYGLIEPGASGGLLKRLFSARTLGLVGALPGAGVADYLSGLLLGAEIREAVGCLGGAGARQTVRIVGSPGLAARYHAALALAGLEGQEAMPDAAARGHLVLARTAGLIGRT